MADYIYTLETRLLPEQMRALVLVQDAARAHEMNVYLTGGAIRDLMTGFPIRDLDFTVQGNALKLQKDLERAGAIIEGIDEDLKILYARLPGNVRAEIAMARSEVYEKAGKGPSISPATINEDLRRRDFTINAMALSLNPGSRGLLLDPSNGAADAEAHLIRILHNYAFLEEPSRLIRAARFAARFDWPLEERTQARYDSAKENKYIEYISSKAVGLEIEQLAHEDDPLKIIKALEREGWLQVLHEKWSVAKIDAASLAQVTKLRQQLFDVGMNADTSAVVLYFLTRKLSDAEIAAIRRIIPRKELVASWKNIEDDAKELAKTLNGKEASTPSGAWKVLSAARPDLILFLAITSKQTAVTQKISNFLGKWQQVKTKLPFPEMAEMRITPSLPEYPEIAERAFLLLLDGKLRTHNEIVNFLKPYEPPPPPPPPPARGRRAKAAVAAEAPAPVVAAAPQPVETGRGRKRAEASAPVEEMPQPKQHEPAPNGASAKAAKAAKATKGAKALTAAAEKVGKAAGKVVKAVKAVASTGSNKSGKKSAPEPRKAAPAPRKASPAQKKAVHPKKVAKAVAKKVGKGR